MQETFSSKMTAKRNLLVLLVLAGITWGLGPVSCANSGGGGGGGSGTIVTTPGTCNVPSATCNTSEYGGISGIQIPGLEQSSTNGYCGCGNGLYPVYNSTWGIACVPSTYMTSSYTYYGYGYQSIYSPQNYGSPGALQQVYYNNPNQVSGTAGCYSSVAAACPLNTTGACAGGATCVPLGNSSTVGVCAQGVNGSGSGYTTTNGTYNNGYNNGYYNNGYDTYNNGYYNNGYNVYNNGYYNNGAGYYNNGGGYYNGGYSGGAGGCRTNRWGLYICGYIY